MFAERVQSRRREYEEAFRRNCECPEIDEILVFREGQPELPACSKLSVRDIGRRAEYRDYLDWVNELAQPDDISIIANADIYFDTQLALLRRHILAPTSVMALSRWERAASGDIFLHDHNDSQDAWVFRGPAREMCADFPVGVPRCDNRFVSELEKAGYNVINPSFSIRSYHVHAGQREAYPAGGDAGFVPPPYGYVWPHNLMPLHSTVLHNLHHPSEKLGWRFDKRRWSSRLKLHWFARALKFLGATSHPR